MDVVRMRPSVWPGLSRSVGRVYWLGLVALVLPALAMAEPLTEAVSLRLGLDQEDFVQILESRAESARGRLVSTRTWSNPEIELAREQTDDETETGIWLRQALDLSGRRRLMGDAAGKDLGVVQASNQTRRIQRAETIRRYFYRVLYQQQKQEIITRWVAKFSDVETAMKKRERAGDVSGYDRLRINREKVALLALQRQGKAEHGADWQRLLGVVDPQNSRTFDTVEGSLETTQLRPLSQLLERLVQHPALVLLRHHAESSRLTARAVARSRIPDITLGVGQKIVDGPDGDTSGLMLSVSVPVPVFDRNQGEHRRANAEAIEAQSEYQMSLRQAQADVRALWQKATRLRDNVRLFSQQGVTASTELVTIAEALYDANEIGVLELIDAYRNAQEAETTALKLALEARLVRIELDVITEGVM